jgi:hypothetical protein
MKTLKENEMEEKEKKQTIEDAKKALGTPLDALKDMLVNGEITKDVKYKGHTYTFASLNEEEEVWRDKFVSLDTPLVLASSTRAPTLAIALRKLDGVYVEDVFDSLELPNDATKKYIVADKLFMDYFKKMKREHITELYKLYEAEIVATVAGAVAEVKNS